MKMSGDKPSILKFNGGMFMLVFVRRAQPSGGRGQEHDCGAVA